MPRAYQLRKSTSNWVHLSWRLLALAALTLTFAMGCTKRSHDLEVEYPGGQKATLAAGETLRLNIQSEPPSLDWHKATDTTSSQITTNTMEGLVEYDLKSKEMSLVPGLALKWEPSDSALKWKFTLREGVVWNDGQPFVAQHVLDGWKRLLAKETASEYAYFLFGVKNAEAFNQGKVPWEQVGVKISAPNEISVELEKPMAYFPMLLTHHSTYPIRLDVVSKNPDRWTDPVNIVTLGAFNLRVWQHDKMIVLERNEKYYGAKEGHGPAIKNIAFYMIQEQATAINLFDSGKLDAVQSLPSVELRKLKTRKEFAESKTLTTLFYGFNVNKPPVNDVRVRRAISMAIDRKEITDMLAGGQVPMTSWIPQGIAGFDESAGLKFDPVKAKALLKEAGYSDPAKMPKLEFHFNTNEDHQRVAENIQAQLRRNIGVGMEIKNEEWKVFLASIKTDAPPMFRFGWAADYPDANNFMDLMTSYSDNNRSKWKNARYDELVKKAASVVNPEERKKIYSETQKILVEDEVPVIPLYASVAHYLISPRVQNYPLNVMNIYDYKGVTLKP